jgi:hypothetical protein
MPALLTAAVIVCGALRQPGAPLACRAQVYHGIYAEQPECAKLSTREAIRLEAAVVQAGELTRTSSHGECFYAADEGSIVFYLPEFMKVHMGAKTSAVVHYDLVDGTPVERKAIKKVKGASI